MGRALRWAPPAGRIAAIAALAVLACGLGSRGQEANRGLSVVPVSFEMASGQMTAVLNLQNNTEHDVDFQVRAFAWGQPGGVDQLTPTDTLIASPPLGHMSVNAGQVVRLVLRRPAQGGEAAYRILLDQLPPPPQPGVVGLALRLSIPVFAQPKTRVAPRLSWSIQSGGGAHYLVAVNHGDRHDTIRDMVLSAAGGRPIALEANASPYVLPGATRRWRIASKDFAPSREGLHLTARADTGPVDQPVSISDAAP
ncbi:MAG TPA: fimbria/pilus periplasmic chaperone [Rhizomicrobium sp.]|nr:fimbria/pilus periplasmic chaperone [Rhizomicrobium sp.]